MFALKDFAFHSSIFSFDPVACPLPPASAGLRIAMAALRLAP